MTLSSGTTLQFEVWKFACCLYVLAPGTVSLIVDLSNLSYKL